MVRVHQGYPWFVNFVVEKDSKISVVATDMEGIRMICRKRRGVSQRIGEKNKKNDSKWGKTDLSLQCQKQKDSFIGLDI